MRPRNLLRSSLLLARRPGHRRLRRWRRQRFDDDAATTEATTTALTKEELISRGDSICAEVNAAVGTVGENTEAGNSQVGQVADLYIGMVESLKGLGTPDDTTGYSEFIYAGEELAQAESDAKLADERGDSAALSEAETRSTSALALLPDGGRRLRLQRLRPGSKRADAGLDRIRRIVGIRILRSRRIGRTRSRSSARRSRRSRA